jgi:integrase
VRLARITYIRKTRTDMGMRGPSSFKRLDAERAIRSAREAGLEPAMIEIVTKDGTIFRVYGDNAALTEIDTGHRRRKGVGAGDGEAEGEDTAEAERTMSKLHHVQSYRGYHYFRRKGVPCIPLPGIVGSAEFMAAYQQALVAAPKPIGKSLRSTPGSISAAIAEYYESQAFRSLTGGTPAQRRMVLERFREQYGEKSLASLPKEFVVALLDTMAPNTAQLWLKSFRHFFRWCEQRKLLRADPTWGIRLKMPKSDGHHTWTEDEIATFEAHHAVGSKARLAFALGLYTAQRRGDVVRIGRQHIRDGMLTVRQQKTGTTLAIPVHAELARIIDATPIGHLTLLITRFGRSYRSTKFSDQFRAWCEDAGLPQRCVFHGLRKAAARRLAELGCTAHEIAAITGHKSLREVEHYTRAVDQARLAKAAMAKAGENKNRTQSVEPDEAKVSNPLIKLTN